MSERHTMTRNRSDHNTTARVQWDLKIPNNRVEFKSNNPQSRFNNNVKQVVGILLADEGSFDAPPICFSSRLSLSTS